MPADRPPDEFIATRLQSQTRTFRTFANAFARDAHNDLKDHHESPRLSRSR